MLSASEWPSFAYVTVRIARNVLSCDDACKFTVLEFLSDNTSDIFRHILTYFIATPPYRGWQRSEGLLLLHSFLSLDISVAFSILRFGTSARSVSWVGLTQFNRTWRTRRCFRHTGLSLLPMVEIAKIVHTEDEIIAEVTPPFKGISSWPVPQSHISIIESTCDKTAVTQTKTVQKINRKMT